MQAVLEQARRRIPVHALMILGVWPLASLLMAAVEIRALPYYAVSPAQALLGAAAGTVVLGRDFLVVGLLALAVSTLAFGALAAAGIVPPGPRRVLAAEPVLLFLAAFAATAACYPTVVAHPVLTFADTVPVLPVTIGLAAVAAAAAVARSGGWRGAATAAVTLAIGAGLPQPVYRGWRSVPVGPGRAPLVVLGLDSLSYDDDLAPLRALAERPGGTWYTHAVTPGLFTNAVWASILLGRPVREHGIFHTFQPFPPSADTLVTRAEAVGFRTVSVFPDQITCAVGSEAGFDDDRSGPVGWRQLATQIVGNASLLLPVVRPVLPAPLLGPVPANHAGTFTYDLDRELDGIFAEGDRDGRALVVAHLTFLHHPRYPSYRELGPEERRRVRGARAGQVRDRTFDWQAEHTHSDAIELRTWKLARLTAAVGAAIDRTRFLAPDRGGQLLLLSDHGDRVGLTPNTFWKPAFHRVPLLTIGLPARPDPEAPVSLLDVAQLVGLGPQELPRDPAVEFTVAVASQWPQLVRSATLHWDGGVTLDSALLGDVFHGLRLHRPWPAHYPAQVYLVFAAPPPTS